MKKSKTHESKNKLILWVIIIILFAGILFTLTFLKNKHEFSNKYDLSIPDSTPLNNDREQIQNELKNFVPANSGVKSFEVIDLKISENFAKVMIKPLDVETDNATIILKKDLGEWKVVWGPGTDGFQDLPGLPEAFNN